MNHIAATDLLGEHRKIVEEIEGYVLALRAPDREEAVPQVVLLRGESGVGKTRIIQEVYSRLQRGDDYWPADLAPEQSGADCGSRGRKVVVPNLDTFMWPKDALPTFAWWGLNCERLEHGGVAETQAAMRAQLNAHTLPLALAIAENRNFSERVSHTGRAAWSSIRDAFIDEAGDAGVDAVEEALSAFNIVIPFAGTLASWGVKGFKSGRSRLQEKRDLGRDVSLGERGRAARRGVAAELAEVVSGLTHAEVPAVVAIEDMHLMGPDLAEFLKELESLEGRLLVIGTVWPEGQANTVFDAWSRTASSLRVVDVPRLDAHDLAELVRRAAPRTEQRLAQEVAQHFGNPHALKMWLGTPSIRQDIEDENGALLLEGPVADLPKGMDAVLDQRWSELDDRVRYALAVVIAASPKDQYFQQLGPFVPGVITRIVQKVAPESVGRLEAGLEGAINPAAWCLVEEDVSRFVEPPLTERARRGASEEIGKKRHRALEDAMCEVVIEALNETLSEVDLDRADIILLSRLADAYAPSHAEQFSPGALGGLALALATEVLAHVAWQADESAEAVRLFQRAVQLWGEAGRKRDAWQSRERLARVLWAAGRVEEAAAQQRLVVEAQQSEGADDAVLLESEYVAAVMGSGLRPRSEVREALKRWLHHLERNSGDAGEILTVKANLAEFLPKDGKEELLTRLGPELDDYVAGGGDEVSMAVAVRVLLARVSNGEISFYDAAAAADRLMSTKLEEDPRDVLQTLDLIARICPEEYVRSYCARGIALAREAVPDDDALAAEFEAVAAWRGTPPDDPKEHVREIEGVLPRIKAARGIGDDLVGHLSRRYAAALEGLGEADKQIDVLRELIAAQRARGRVEFGPAYEATAKLRLLLNDAGRSAEARGAVEELIKLCAMGESDPVEILQVRLLEAMQLMEEGFPFEALKNTLDVMMDVELNSAVLEEEYAELREQAGALARLIHSKAHAQRQDEGVVRALLEQVSSMASEPSGVALKMPWLFDALVDALVSSPDEVVVQHGEDVLLAVARASLVAGEGNNIELAIAERSVLVEAVRRRIRQDGERAGDAEMLEWLDRSMATWYAQCDLLKHSSKGGNE